MAYASDYQCTDPAPQGLEIVVDSSDKSGTLLRWGMGIHGEQLAFHSGRILQDDDSYSTFWMQASWAGAAQWQQQSAADPTGPQIPPASSIRAMIGVAAPWQEKLLSSNAAGGRSGSSTFGKEKLEKLMQAPPAGARIAAAASSSLFVAGYARGRKQAWWQETCCTTPGRYCCGKADDSDQNDWSLGSERVQVLALLLLACVANQACRALPFYLVDFAPDAQADRAMNQDLAFSSADYGLFATLGFTIPFTIASLWAGVAADSIDRFRLTVAAGIGWSIATASMASATSYNMLLLQRGLLGLFQAAINPAALSVISELFPDARATANSVFGLGIYVGGAVASLGAAVDEREGWRTACLGFGFVSALASLPLLFRSEASGPSKEGVRWPSDPFAQLQSKVAALPGEALSIVTKSAEAVSAPSARWLLLASTLRFSAGFAILVWLPTAIRASFPNDVEQFAVINSLIKAFAGGASSLAGGVTADALRARGFGDQAAALFCGVTSLASAPLWYCTLGDGLSFETCMGFLLVEYLVAESWLGPAISALQGAVSVGQRGTAQGVFSSLTALGNGLPVVLGLLAPEELAKGLQVSVSVCYLLSGLSFLMASANLKEDPSAESTAYE
eukprot:s1955_g12.t1